MFTKVPGHGNAITELPLCPRPEEMTRPERSLQEAVCPGDMLRATVGCGDLDQVAGGQLASALALPRMPVWLLRS